MISPRMYGQKCNPELSFVLSTPHARNPTMTLKWVRPSFCLSVPTVSGANLLYYSR